MENITIQITKSQALKMAVLARKRIKLIDSTLEGLEATGRPFKNRKAALREERRQMLELVKALGVTKR